MADDQAARARVPIDAQLVVSLAIVIAMTVLGLALIGVACWMKNWEIAAAGGVGTIFGALATALNSPSGVTSAIAAAQKAAGQ